MRYVGLVFLGMVLWAGQALAFLEKDTCQFLEDRVEFAMKYYQSRGDDLISTNSAKREDAQVEVKVALESAVKHSTVYLAGCKE